MSGKDLTKLQVKLYMDSKLKCGTQIAASARTGISVSSARRMEKGSLTAEVWKQKSINVRKCLYYTTKRHKICRCEFDCLKRFSWYSRNIINKRIKHGLVSTQS